MAEIKITGWKAVIILFGVAIFIAFRIISIGDMTDNEVLMRKVKMELMSEYFPYEINKAEKALEKGKTDDAFDRVGKLATTEIDVQDLKGSYPVYVFSTGKRDVVIKVRFTITDEQSVVKDGINFYLCEHHPFGNTWYIKHSVSQYRYYMNFIL
ncbi:MAG: hypothetical protein JW983_05940 [Elusimicrobia bacterium]|nr:hypothetical protein [Elusimicrobiota bacterium]